MAGQGLSRVDSSSLPINLDQYGVRKANQGDGEQRWDFRIGASQSRCQFTRQWLSAKTVL